MGLSRRLMLLGGGAVLTATAAGLPRAARAGTSGVPRRDDLIGEVAHYLTDGERTLLEVARQYNVGVPQISALNPGVDAWVPGKERPLTLPTMHILPDAAREGIVINMAELRLYYFPKGGAVQSYAIGVGRDGFNTPVGGTRVVRKVVGPVWRPTTNELREKPWLPRVFPAGPDNPMGAYAMYLGWPEYAMHGTDKPYGVGRRTSHGCIRMYPEGVARLYPQVPVGTKVTVVAEPVKVGWHEGELYLEVLPSLAQIDQLEASYSMTPDPAPDPRPLIAAKAAGSLDRVDWNVVAAETLARRGLPVQITGTAAGDSALVSQAGGGNPRTITASNGPAPLPTRASMLGDAPEPFAGLGEIY